MDSELWGLTFSCPIGVRFPHIFSAPSVENLCRMRTRSRGARMAQTMVIMMMVMVVPRKLGRADHGGIRTFERQSM